MLKYIAYLTKKKLRIVVFNVSRDFRRIIKDKSIELPQEIVDPSHLKGIIQKEGLAKSRFLSCFFRHEVGVRFFSFPSRQEQEIARMVDYEAAELLPLKPEETITRHLVLNSRPDGYSDTFVVVTHKEEVEKRVKIFESAGAEIESLGLSSLAIFACVKKLIIEKNKSSSKGNFLIVYQEDDAVEVIIIKNENLVFSRGFLMETGNDFHKGLISEIRHSISLFSDTKKEDNFDRIIISGHGVNLDEIKETLKDKFDVPIYIEEKIDIAYGLSLGNKSGINLLSNEFVNARTKKKLKKKILLMLSLLTISIILSGVLFITRLHNKKAYLDSLKERMTQLKPQAKELQNKLVKIQMVKVQLNSQILILNAISDLVRVTSSSCVLNMLSVNEEGVLVLRGQAENLQEVLDFVSKLENSPYFEDSHLNYSSRRKIRDKEVLDFEIQARLMKEKINN
ncbi:MAG: PilN domain-containing protein [Candidatus Omnitrophota bacterium]